MDKKDKRGQAIKEPKKPLVKKSKTQLEALKKDEQMGNSGILAVSNMESTFEKNVSPEIRNKLEKERKDKAKKVKA